MMTPPYANSLFFEHIRPGQLLEDLFDNIPDVHFFIKDKDSRFVGGSLSFAQTLGCKSLADIMGKTDYDFTPNFLADAYLKDDQSVLKTGTPIKNKVELVPLSDGSLDWLSTCKIPLYDVYGSIIGLAGTTRVIRDDESAYARNPQMQLIVNFIRQSYSQKISISDSAKAADISISKQERLFKNIFGISPLMYLRRTRLNAACRMLRMHKHSIQEVAIACGFNDQTNMTRAFRQELKITPYKYLKSFSKSGALPSPRKV